jgi:4-amino-4-deoxy-L-arabinose transferase-like glycosyltransferase
VVAIGTLLWGGRAGLLAGLILTTSLPLFTFGHLAIPDMMLGAFLTWSLYWFLRAWRLDWAVGPLVKFYLFVALAILTKGPPGFAALAAVVVTILVTDGPRGLLRLRPVLGLSILVLCALPWILPYYLLSRGQFESEVLVGEYGIWIFRFKRSVLGRLAGLGETLIAFFPWTIFLVAAPWWWRRAPDEGRRRVVLWTLTLWVLFVFSGVFQTHYLVPVYPLLALLTAEFLARGGAQEGRRPLRIAAAVSLVCAIAVALALIVRPTLLGIVFDVAFVPGTRWERGFAAMVVVGGSTVAYVLARREAWAAMTVAGALTLAPILVLTGVGYPARDARAHDVRPLAAAAAGHLAPGGTVVAYPELRLSYDFYLRRPVVEIGSVERMLALLASPTPGQVVIMSRKDWQALIAQVPSSWRVLEARTVGGREIVVAGSPPP